MKQKYYWLNLITMFFVSLFIFGFGMKIDNFPLMVYAPTNFLYQMMKYHFDRIEDMIEKVSVETREGKSKK